MAFPNEPTDLLSIDIAAMEATARKRRRRNLLIVSGALGIVAVGGAITATAMNREAAQETNRVVSRLATCLLDDPATAWTPSRMIRAEQLAAWSTPPHAQVTAWPAVCSKAAYEVAENAKGRGNAPLEAAATTLAKALEKENSYLAPFGALADRVFDEASKAGAHPSLAADVARPPKPAAALDASTLPTAARWLESAVPLQNVHGAPFPETQVRFLMDDAGMPGGPHVCTFEPAASRVVCHLVPEPAAKKSPALRLWGTTADGKTPFVFAGNRGEAGIYRGDDGAMVAPAVKYGAYGAAAQADGSFAYLAWNDEAPQIRLQRVSPDGAVRETKLLARSETGNPYYSTALFDDWVFYKAIKGRDIRLMARTIGNDAATPIDIGLIRETGLVEGGQGEDPHLTACRSEEGMVVRAKGWSHTYFSFYSSGAWTPTVESAFTGGELYCRGSQASVVGMSGHESAGRYWPTFVIDRCSAAGCKQTDASFEQKFGEDPELAPTGLRDVRVVPIDDNLLVVWRAGDNGGLRMRLGPPEDMSVSHETVLYDDHVDEAGMHVEPSLIEFALWSTGKDALLLLHTTKGLYGFHIDKTGALAPVSLVKK